MLLSIAFLLIAFNIDLSHSYCRETGLCCKGRDSSCLIQTTRKVPFTNEIAENSCYCDHACITLGDCCPDYQETCKVVDCQVTAWGPWSECSESCGSGTMVRTRERIRGPDNGGSECPELEQKRACNGQKCAPKTHEKVARESAFLLPSRFHHQREINSTATILKTVMLKTIKDQEINEEEYCVVFNVTKSRKACEENENTRRLTIGRQICVACESAAMRKNLGHRCHGHGVEHAQTRWTSLSSGNGNCHGRWTRVAKYSQCPCNGGAPDYIFV